MPTTVESELTTAEIEAAMREFEQMERARIFRACVEEAFCGYCQKPTLRVVLTGARFRLTCICNFTTPPA
jgi:hypothetical protein